MEDWEDAKDWDDIPAHCKDCRNCRHYIPKNVIINNKGKLCCRISNFEFIENYSPDVTCSFFESWEKSKEDYLQQKTYNNMTNIYVDEEDDADEYEEDQYGRVYKRISNSEGYSEKLLANLLSIKDSLFSNNNETIFGMKVRSVVITVGGMLLCYWFISSITVADVMNFFALIFLLMILSFFF